LSNHKALIASCSAAAKLRKLHTVNTVMVILFWAKFDFQIALSQMVRHSFWKRL